MKPHRKIILYIAASLDGYIAKPNDDLTFLSMVEQPGEDYGYNSFINTVDTIVMGRKTYDWVMTQAPAFLHANIDTYIITKTPKPNVGKTIFYTGDLKELIINLKSKAGKNIFIDGGAEVVNSLLQGKLIDELYISVIPVLLGEGVRLFKDSRPEQPLTLIESKAFQKGLVQLHYKCLI